MMTKYTFFQSYHEALKGVDDETYGRIVRAISQYAFEEEEPTLEGADRIFFALAKPLIDVARKRAEAGAKGGQQGAGVSRNAGNQHAAKDYAKQKQINSKTKADKDMDKEKDMDMEVEKGEKDKEKDNNSGVRRFTPPAVGDVEAYCSERQNGIDAQSFVDFYESKGWMVGRNKMKSWQAAVRTWENSRRTETRAKEEQNGGVKVETDRMGNRIAVYPDGYRATLGSGEYIDEEGNRRYNQKKPAVPRDAKPRPGADYSFSKADGAWVTGV